MKITAPIVFIFLLFSAIPAFASQFQPIAEITEFEKEIISNAAKKPADEVLKNAVEFRINRNLVVLKFQNGDDGYYSYGTKSSFTEVREPEKDGHDDGSLNDHSRLNTSSKISESGSEEKKEVKETAESKSYEEIIRAEARKIYEKLWLAWPTVKDENKEARLQEADYYAIQYISFISDKIAIMDTLYDLSSMASFSGNRYMHLIEPLIQTLDKKRAISIYDSFLNNSVLLPPENNFSDREKIEIIKKIKEIYPAELDYNALSVNTVNEILRLDMKTFKKLGLSCPYTNNY